MCIGSVWVRDVGCCRQTEGCITYACVTKLHVTYVSLYGTITYVGTYVPCYQCGSIHYSCWLVCRQAVHLLCQSGGLSRVIMLYPVKLPADMTIVWNKRLVKTAGFCTYIRWEHNLGVMCLESVNGIGNRVMQCYVTELVVPLRWLALLCCTGLLIHGCFACWNDTSVRIWLQHAIYNINLLTTKCAYMWAELYIM